MAMTVTEIESAAPPGGLAALGEVALTGRWAQMMDEARAACHGPAAWRCRKLAEARDLLAMSQIAQRFKVQQIDVREALRAVALLRVPVPCRPDEQGRLQIARVAVLALTYPQEALFRPLPGYSFVSILEPRGIWHANIVPDRVQATCLGDRLPAGIPMRELVLMTYGALAMQAVQIDPGDPAGVLNPEAARWWQANLDLVPLTRAGFLEPAD